MGGSSERFGADQDIQSKFIKKSAFQTITGADIIKYIALYSAKKCQWQGAGRGVCIMLFHGWKQRNGRLKGIWVDQILRTLELNIIFLLFLRKVGVSSFGESTVALHSDESCSQWSPSCRVLGDFKIHWVAGSSTWMDLASEPGGNLCLAELALLSLNLLVNAHNSCFLLFSFRTLMSVYTLQTQRRM